MGTTQSQNWPYRGFKEILYPYIEPVLSLAIYMLRLIKSSTILTWSVSTYERNPLFRHHII
jgi:hypothetical protein